MTCPRVIAVLVMEIAISFSSFSCLLVFSDLGLIPDLVEGLFPWSEPLYSRSTWRSKGFISFRLPRSGLIWDLFSILLSLFREIFYSSGLLMLVSAEWLAE